MHPLSRPTSSPESRRPVRQHFIRDVGIIQIFGAAFAIGLIRPTLRVHLWAVATLWLIAHALFHFWEVAVGICAPSALARDFAAVTLPALIGVLLAAWAWSSEREVWHLRCDRRNQG